MVPWVLKDYENQTWTPIRYDIESMGCTVQLRNKKKGKSSRVTIKREKARDALIDFLHRTAEAFGDVDFSKVSNPQIRFVNMCT